MKQIVEVAARWPCVRFGQSASEIILGIDCKTDLGTKVRNLLTDTNLVLDTVGIGKFGMKCVSEVL